MAELAPPTGKFGHPSGQVWLKDCPDLLLYSQTSVSHGINLTYKRSELLLRNTI